MKSNSNERPQIIQDLGNGSYYYNAQITPTTSTDPDGQERAGFDYNSILFWGKPERAKIVKAVIRDEMDESREFDLVNSYNAAKAGLIEDEDAADAAEAAYLAHLRRVQEIKTQVKADLAAAGYND